MIRDCCTWYVRRDFLQSSAEEKDTKGSSYSPNPHPAQPDPSQWYIGTGKVETDTNQIMGNTDEILGKSLLPWGWSSFGMDAQREWAISILLREPEFGWTKPQETCSWLGTGLSRDPFWSKLFLWFCDFVVLMINNLTTLCIFQAIVIRQF